MNSNNSEISRFINSEFPLNAELFEAFISAKIFSLCATFQSNNKERLITDGEAIFSIVISNLIKAGVQFSNPGNSKKRNFILWFNSHFVINKSFSPSIEINPKYFEVAYDIALGISKEYLHSKMDTTESTQLNTEVYEILTLNGKRFLKDLCQ